MTEPVPRTPGPPARPRGVWGVLRPLRRLFARFSLVYEEQGRTLDDIRVQIAASDARLLPEVNRLRGEVRRIQRENAAIVRLIAGPRGADAAVRSVLGERDVASADDGDDGDRPAILVLPAAPGIDRRGLFAEVERGSRQEITAKVEGYLPIFRGAGPVVDLGCGRGEFLEVAARHGLAAYGVDTDTDAIAACKELGLDGREEDLFEHLQGLTPGSLGGVFCAQVVEHLPPDLLPELMADIARALRPGGVALIETPNPASFATHVHSFWRDPTHIRPVPDAALAYAARTAGLVVETTVYSSLPDAKERLQPVGVTPSDPDLRALVDGFNAMAGRLNELLYGYQDYALVIAKPRSPSSGDEPAARA
jgi:SAM-dependent methyltransferase